MKLICMSCSRGVIFGLGTIGKQCCKRMLVAFQELPSYRHQVPFQFHIFISHYYHQFKKRRVFLSRPQ